MRTSFLVVAVGTFFTSVSARSINFIIAIAGEIPLTGYYTVMPYFDASIQMAAELYPKVFQNVTKDVFYQPGSGAQCDDADAEMPDITGRIYNTIENSDAFPILFASGCTFGMGGLADLGREIDVPFFTITTDPALGNRKRCPTTVSFSSRGPSGHATAVKAFLLYHQWTTVTLFCDAMSRGAISAFLVSHCRFLTGVLATGFQLYKENYDTSKSVTEYRTLLRRAQSQSRIIIILTGAPELRKIMAQAYHLNMTNGEFVFLYATPLRAPGFMPVVVSNGIDNDTDIIYDAYQSLVTMNFPVPRFAQLSNFTDGVGRIASSTYGKVFSDIDKNNEITLAIPEMVLAIGQLLNNSGTPLDNLTTGQFLNSFMNRNFPNGDFRSVYVGPEGTRLVNSIFYKLNLTTSSFTPAWMYDAATRKIEKLSSLAYQWRGSTNVPLNEPVCGFRHNRCDATGSQMVLIGAICGGAGLCAVVILGAAAYVKHLSAVNQGYSWELQSMNFKVDTAVSTEMVSAVYNDEIVLAHAVAYKCSVSDTRSGRMPKLLKQLSAMRHDNIGQFHGVAISDHIAYAVWVHGRGTLRTILANDTITADGDVKLHFIYNVLMGLHYIHNKILLKVHGSLCTSTVILDNRFTAKICDVGSAALIHEMQRPGSFEPTPALDIGCLGVVFHEILRGHAVTLQDTIPSGLVRFGTPKFQSALLEIIQQCCLADPVRRPSTTAIVARLGPFRRKGTVVEIMLKRLEEHAERLEIVVGQRTEELLAERKNVDKLLSEIIPVSIVQRLREKGTVPAETFSSATIYFSSMVGFDEFCKARQPDEAREYLNGLYNFMDCETTRFDVYKVETVKDSYMVASGLPMKNGNQHVYEIASMALHIANGCSVDSVQHLLPIRIGIHTGPVVAGIVGVRMPRYCLFGDTINTASRMESHGEASKVHVSPDTAHVLAHRKEYKLQSRGEIVIKGKGVIETFWLTGL